MTNEDYISVFFGKETNAEIFFLIPILLHQFLDVYFRIIGTSNDSLLLLRRFLLPLLLFDLGSIRIFVLLFIQFEIVPFADLLNVVKLLFIEIEANGIVGSDCFPPEQKVLKGWHLESKDIDGDVRLKVSEESKVLAFLLFSPFLIDGLPELLDDVELHHEELLVVGVDEPLGGGLVVEVEWRLLDFLLPLRALPSH